MCAKANLKQMPAKQSPGQRFTYQNYGPSEQWHVMSLQQMLSWLLQNWTKQPACEVYVKAHASPERCLITQTFHTRTLLLPQVGAGGQHSQESSWQALQRLRQNSVPPLNTLAANQKG